jgi:serine protease Do
LGDIIEGIAPVVVKLQVFYYSAFSVAEVSRFGSGVVYNTTRSPGKAYILTAQHVVDGALRIKVISEEGSTFAATLRSEDKNHDLAVVEVCCDNLTVAAAIADSSRVRRGDSVIALGYPSVGSGELTVTQGIVSALHTDTEYGLNTIQFDAAVNRGNSGGPLLLRDGSLVGIVTAKWIGYGVEGVGLAVAINSAREIMAK